MASANVSQSDISLQRPGGPESIPFQDEVEGSQLARVRPRTRPPQPTEALLLPRHRDGSRAAARRQPHPGDRPKACALHLVVDATGLKVFGHGGWAA